MSNHIFLDRSYDLFITMTWPKYTHKAHGICGHLYEVIDYYLLIKKHYKTGILVGDNMSVEQFMKAVVDKYNLSDLELAEMIEHTVFTSRPKIITGNNILFVDGLLKQHFQEGGVILKFNNILTFRCSPRSTHHDLHYKNIHLLQDDRVYNDLDKQMSIHYIKKIYFDRYKKYTAQQKTNTALLYGTCNCRFISSEMLYDIILKYEFEKYLLITDKIEMYPELPASVEVAEPPVNDIFNKFDTYIYTPATKIFDCSPRFIAECAYYDKSVEYHDIDQEHLNINTGLNVRINDISTDLDNIMLKDTDNIISILNEII